MPERYRRSIRTVPGFRETRQQSNVPELPLVAPYGVDSAASVPASAQEWSRARVEIRVFLDRARKSLIIAPRGELDFANVDVIGRALIVFGTFQFRHVVINAEDLSFCDCGGLSALLAAQRLVRSAGGELTIIRMQPAVRRLLELTGHAEAFGSSVDRLH